jgi:hypothetical protein
MIVLVSSGGEEIYQQFVLQVLCYPCGHILPDVPYSLARVCSPFDQSPDDLKKGTKAVIVLVDYVPSGNLTTPLEPVFVPLREATISRARRFAGKLLLDLTLDNYCYYDEQIKQSYDDKGTDIAPRFWSRVIRSIPQSPHPAPASGGSIDPSDPKSWVSAGKFVLQIDDDKLDLRVLSIAEQVRAERDDWKSVVDMVTKRGQFEEKLFYQVSEFRSPDTNNSVPLLTVGDRTVYALTAGTSAELVLHFYQGRKRQSKNKSVLQVSTDNTYLTTLGTISIDVYPNQTSGKIEHLRLIAKKQLSQEFTRLTINEAVGTPALASAELYIRLNPRKWQIPAILLMFVLGTFLNSLPEHFKWLWLWKVVGAILMTLSFWLAFSKLPGK